MRHKDRVMMAFRGEIPDRVGIFEQAFASSVASEMLGRKVYTGSTSLHYEEAKAWVQGKAAHEEFLEKCYEDTIALAQHLELDALYMPWRIATRPSRQVDEFTFIYGDENSDDWYTMTFDPASQTYGKSMNSRPSAPVDVVSIMKEQISKLAAVPKPTSENLNPMVVRAGREYGKEYAIPSSGAAIAIPMQVPWLEATILERELVEDYLDALTEWSISMLPVIKAAGVDYINGGGDFADNNGPIYSPIFYREVMSPRWHKIMSTCRELDLPYVMRSDGNLWPVADELFGKIRPHGYGEIDWAAGMDPKQLREAFPELVLFGNVPCGTTLIEGTPENVAETTMYVIDSAAPRLVLGSSNSILHGTPVDNVYAMFETAKTYSAKLYREVAVG